MGNPHSEDKVNQRWGTYDTRITFDLNRVAGICLWLLHRRNFRAGDPYN